MQAMQGSMTTVDEGEDSVVVPWWMATGIIPVGVYAAKGAASQIDSYINLANAALPLTPIVAPTWNATDGWLTNGTSQYLSTGIVANTIRSMLVRFTGASQNSYYAAVIGAYSSESNAISIHPYHSAGGIVYYNGGSGGVLKAPKLDAGVLGVAGGNGYRNGILDATISGTGSRPSTAITIGVAGTLYFKGGIQAALLFTQTLTDAEMLLASNAMAAL